MEIQKATNKSVKSGDSLSKYLAQSGVTSRRKAVDLIKSGVVTVNDVVIKEPGFKIAKQDSVKVGENSVQSEKKVYILMNKPKNCISTVSDDKGRAKVVDIIASAIKERMYPIGRLDRNTTGILVLTNDGGLTLKLSHPRYEIEKIYHARLHKTLGKGDMLALVDGVTLDTGETISVDEIYFTQPGSKKDVGVVIHSGQYHIVHRLFAQLGYEVEKLDRVFYAGLTKAGLKPGEWRHLTGQEIAHLKQL